jgi:MFS family permease
MSEQTLKHFVRSYAWLGGFGGILTGLLAPVMYVVLKDKGFDNLQIGMLVLATAAVTAIFNIPFGVVADRYGRKLIFLAGEFFMFVFSIGFVLFDTFPVILGFMALAGLSAAMVSGTLDALFVDTIESYSSDPKVVQQSLAVAGGYQMGGVFAGAMLSIALVYVGNGWRDMQRFDINYYVSAALMPLHMLAAYLLLPSDLGQRRAKAGGTRFANQMSGVFSTCINNSVLGLLMLSSAVSALAFMSFEKFWQIKLSNLVSIEGGHWLFGAVFAGSMLVSMVGQLLSPPLCRLFGNNYNNVMVVIRVLMAIAFSSLYFFTGLVAFIVAFLSIFLIAAMSASPLMTMFHSQVREADRTSMLSLRAVFLQVGAMFGILMAAYASHIYSLEFAFLLSAGVFLLSITLMLAPQTAALGRKLAQDAA